MRRGLAESRERAQAAIAAGRVLVGGAVAEKAARQVAPGEAIVVQGEGPRFVGRGGHKLEGALERFAIDPAGCRVLDAGASTGGFTDCVLQHGAREVVAVDVGYGQLHEKVAHDARVRSMERTNIRFVSADDVGGEVDLVVADLSFISLTLVAAKLVELVGSAGDLVVLVKPQFEAGREVVSRGRGIVTDPAVWRDALVRVASAFDGAGAAIMGAMVSPITGTDGNVEFLLHARVGARDSGRPGVPSHDTEAAAQLAAVIDAALAEAAPLNAGRNGPGGR